VAKRTSADERPQPEEATMSNLRTVRDDGDALEDLVWRVRAEHHERPGLQLTPAQAARRFDLVPGDCTIVLDTLCARGFLARTCGPRYKRVQIGAPD
jgi:hypothetical protein